MEEKIYTIAYNIKQLHSQLDPEGYVSESNMSDIGRLIGMIDEALAICPTNEIEHSERLIEWRVMLNHFVLVDRPHMSVI